MVIYLKKKQFEDLLNIIDEYREDSWKTAIQYKRYEMDADDDMVKDQYARIAEEEDDKHHIALELHQYLSALPMMED